MSSPITIVPVFEAPSLGYDKTRIPALVRTTSGALLAFCEGRQGPGGDWARINILMRRSTDGGLTWEAVRILVPSDGGPISNSTPIAARDGSVSFIYQRDYRTCHIIRSEDDGVTWSAPRDITAPFLDFRPEYDWEVLAPGPGHGIELSNGRFVVAVWLCDPAGAEVPGGDHRPSCVATIYSDDHGTTWKRGEIAVNTTGDFLNPSESVVVELSDGRVLLNVRSESLRHRRIVSISPDGATKWSEPAFDEALYEPVCMASLISARDPRNGSHVLLFCNPDSRHKPEEANPLIHFCARENGVIKLSRDDGRTWAAQRVIDAGPFGYSDLAVSPEGTVYCLYDTGVWGNPPHHRDTHISFATFSIQWIEENPARHLP